MRDLALDAIQTALDDVERHGLDAAIWVVDNASVDGTAEAIRNRFPQVRLIASAQNLGFGAGNNRALRDIGFGQDIPSSELPQAVFLLNPDTLVQSGAIPVLYDALFSAPQVGMVGARLAYGDDSFQHSAFGFPGVWQTFIDLFPVPGRLYASRLNGRYPLALYEGGRPFPVDHVLGATMMLRREVVQQVGMFDERFFMYCEEVDWAMRIRRAGWQILCVPRARITHLEGQSAGQVRPASFLNLWKSRFMLYQKHYSPLKVAVIRAVVRLGMRRRIHQTQQAADLTSQEREALLKAYRSVARL